MVKVSSAYNAQFWRSVFVAESSKYSPVMKMVMMMTTTQSLECDRSTTNTLSVTQCAFFIKVFLVESLRLPFYNCRYVSMTRNVQQYVQQLGQQKRSLLLGLSQGYHLTPGGF